jgi:exodeoxyribonuclease VII small subunit
MAKDSTSSKTPPFEDLYARLEETVAKLEQGGLPLEAAIAVYEEGMTLARQCQERLDAAELKITKLKESFAPMPDRANGGQLRDEGSSDYEYVHDEDAALDDEPFT